jgi:hypothetical protein
MCPLLNAAIVQPRMTNEASSDKSVSGHELK